MNWNYDASQYEERSFKPLEAGDYRVRIANAENMTSKTSGNEMTKLTLEVSGNNSKLFNYIVYDQSNQQMANQKLGALFASLGIAPDMNEQHWVGKVGAVRVKHREYNGEPQAEVAYWLTKEKADKLPAWVEPSGGSAPAATVSGGFTEINESDLPF